jgi:hypothetical protein
MTEGEKSSLLRPGFYAEFPDELPSRAPIRCYSSITGFATEATITDDDVELTCTKEIADNRR